MEKEKVTIIIPTLNEERRIAACLETLSKTNHHIITVINGNDRTAQIAKQYPVEIIRQNNGLFGKGGAFLQGLERARTDLVFMIDVDLPVPLRFLDVFQDSCRIYDAVIASRYMPESKVVGLPVKRKILSWGYRRIVKTLFHLGVNDAQCGFKAFRRDALNEVVGKIQSYGYTFDLELLLRLWQAGYSVKEVPVPWCYRPDSKVRIQHSLKMFHSLLRIYSSLKQARALQDF